MPDSAARMKRVQAYVTDVTFNRLTVMAPDRSLEGGGRGSVSDLVNAIIEEWFEAHPEIAEEADRRLKKPLRR